VLKILQDLLELQAVDMRLQDVHARVVAFPKKIAEAEARKAAAKAELEKSKVAQLATVKDRKRYELEVEGWKEKVRKYKEQTSQIKTNEAYKALQHEVQMAEEQIAKAEDRLLEQMVSGEEYDRRIKASEKVLKEVEEIVRGERSKIEAERAEDEKALAELNTKRTAIVPRIPEKMMDHYDRIVKKHHGVALAEVRDEKCTACGMRVRPHVFQEMRRANSEEMFHCETCTRILYYYEPVSSAATASSATPSAPTGSLSNET
jgi:predicted  nucleic acid-binding Zn-ribbon protein